jgi:hypothetical protein
VFGPVELLARQQTDSNLACRREIAEAIKAVAGFDQTEHGELVDDLLRQLAQRSKLVSGVRLGLLFGGTPFDMEREVTAECSPSAAAAAPGASQQSDLVLPRETLPSGAPGVPWPRARQSRPRMRPPNRTD